MTDAQRIVERIADGLTRAQRKAVLGAEEIVRGEMNLTCPDDITYELALGGLANDLDGDCLTPLGLAVRAHLQAQAEETGRE